LSFSNGGSLFTNLGFRKQMASLGSKVSPKIDSGPLSQTSDPEVSKEGDQ